MNDITASTPESRHPRKDDRDAPLPPPPSAGNRLRVWPAVVVIALLWAALMIPVRVAPDEMMVQFMAAMFAPMIALALIAVWWLFASRVPWSHRLVGLLVCAAAGAAAVGFAHPTMGGFILNIFALPLLVTAWVAWLFATPWLRWEGQFVGLLGVFVLSWAAFDLFRFEGTDGEFKPDFQWRWAPDDDDRYKAWLAQNKGGKVGAAQDAKPGDWPGFRGPNRDSVLPGVRLYTDWATTPPREVWRRKIGPGWSSFAVVGNRLYTQEQRGGDEVVLCLDADSGDEVWAYKNPARFTEAIAGPGPRATPTYHDGKIYALGATGLLDCLDAKTGEKVWSRNAAEDAKVAKTPEWGYASSPLVAAGLVSVYVGGPDGKAVVAYQASSGEPAWQAGTGTNGYCSPQLSKLGGVEQVLIATNTGLAAFDPPTGKVLWQNDWDVGAEMARVCQPAVIGESAVLLGTFFGHGTRRVEVSREKDGWQATEAWTTKAIKPYYNDMVLHKGHLYGFDSAFFTCVDLADGKSKWRTRGYGNGQVLLLPEQDLLLILSEQGEVALVEAKPDGYKELARIDAIEGKTWNHPVVAHGKLYVRNGKEMACFELKGR